MSNQPRSQAPVDPELADIAAQYEIDKAGIISSCFSRKDEQGKRKSFFLSHIATIALL